MDDLGVGAGLAVVGFWLFVAGVVAAGIWDSIRKRDAQHETLRRLLEHGQPVDDELMDKLLGVNPHPDRDLKVAAWIVLSLGPGMALMGWLMSFQSSGVFQPLLGVGLLLVCLGTGLWMAAKQAASKQG